PVERVWLYLRWRLVSLQFLPDTDASVEVGCRAWHTHTAHPPSYPLHLHLRSDYEARFIADGLPMIFLIAHGGSSPVLTLHLERQLLTHAAHQPQAQQGQCC